MSPQKSVAPLTRPPVGVPALQAEGRSYPLRDGVTTVGRGPGVDVALTDLTVSRLHAEVVRRGPHVYVADLGLSRNGTLVNGRPVGRAVLGPHDVVNFGDVRARVSGLVDDDDVTGTRDMSRGQRAPDLTRRERDVLAALCRPAMVTSAFPTPASTREVARELVVTEAAVKQHLLRLYHKFSIAEGSNRRTRLANAVISGGLVQPPRDPDAVPRAG